MLPRHDVLRLQIRCDVHTDKFKKATCLHGGACEAEVAKSVQRELHKPARRLTHTHNLARFRRVVSATLPSILLLMVAIPSIGGAIGAFAMRMSVGKCRRAIAAITV